MLKRMRSFLVVVMLLITATMSAQVTTASMSGKVTAQDEPIIGATIVAIHEPSGTRYGTVTNVSGAIQSARYAYGRPLQSRNHLCWLSVSHLQGHPVVIRRKLRIECFFERKFRVVG